MSIDFAAYQARFFSSDSLDIEALTYTQDSTPKSIYGYVTRDPLQVVESGGRKYTQKTIHLRIARSTTLGILVPKYGQDTVTVKEHRGGSDKTYTVLMPVREKDGENAISWVLECRG